jgi:glutathione synthase/RimK-type ligase-like ATP-grasp enzyme
MILLFGTLDDPTLAYVCLCLDARDEEFLVLDGSSYRQQFDLSWSLAGEGMQGVLRYGARHVALAAVRSIYIRDFIPSGAPQHTGFRTDTQGFGPYDAAYETLEAFADTLPGLVVNRPSVSSSNGSKPYQQQCIAQHGFRVPRTLVTTVPEQARQFYEACQGRVIYKSISHQRSIVRMMTQEDVPRLAQVRYCPTQFQEYVPGTDIRVHTVGSRVFATEIITDAVDYRYAGREGATRKMRAVELPADIAERCLHLADHLGMVLSGIDLRRNLQGEYYCFEANPSPVFTFYQTHTQQRIGEALVDILCRGGL